MKAVHFGAGNIGRGFIGLLLHQSGYEVQFVDVNETLIDEINKEKAYRVILANEQKEEFHVEGVSGINSAKAPEAVIEAISSADLVTTAVGPHILKFIAPLIADGLKKRTKENDMPVNIIACENMVGGSSELQKHVLEKLNDKETSWVQENVGFPNSAVDRIVPNQKNDRLLDVLVEPFHEWVIDSTEMKGAQPEIKEALFVENLQAYIERKLFTVNTGHAATAYLGNLAGHATIAESIKDEEIKKTVLGSLEETGKVLVATYGFNADEHQQYIQKIIGRFANPFIVDDVQRVGRAPLRKLGAKDRLVAPALAFMNEFNEVPENLVKVIVAALKFVSEEDQESLTLQEKVQAKGAAAAFSEIAGLDMDHPLVKKAAETF
ncbi:mannitol-1-phosphate 5-dehydrogenase [Metabacillus sediminilitoris]|uniref:Mannitol-1-phosphate 5-dehydrogenase n=1 Tax=Metabacillus sediminilitoris TaxID=2567941 RepID=A0A4V3WFT4_9BACI|nr:mannitol-1-phosphate 5-dehydrogenase [Metabacillus sediminilitoris]QGQ48081.1 mannitol-1-phosphate 5-dehydrogenase [Metabacillus sediminilitoris]THF81557.1 mannitol-1-phosphate 5-dehydrogenase [Metabacillus sediminilitoris]